MRSRLIYILIFTLTFLPFLGLSTVNAASETDDMVGYWKLDEGSADSCSGGEDACDSSTEGNHGTWNGSGGGSITSPTWTSSTPSDINFTNPYGMSFDGTDDFIVSNDNSSLTGNATFSIALWFYVPSSPTTTGSWGRFVDWGSASGGQAAQISLYSSTTNQLFVGHWSTGQATSTTFTNDEWHHAVWVRTGGSDGWSGNKLYIDGSEVTLDIDVNSNITPNVTAGPYYIGGGGSGNFRVENSLDDVRIYDRELTEDEITTLSSGNNLVSTPEPSPAASTETETIIPKDKRCHWITPPELTWLKLEPRDNGMYATWTQYDANKVTILIDDGTGTYPWKVYKTLNDGHEFLPNVQPWQNIKVKPFNHCAEGKKSTNVSYNLYPNGWYITE